MTEQIKLNYGNNEIGYCEVLNKLQTKQKILELFETEEIEEIKIVYKKREPACTADSNN